MLRKTILSIALLWSLQTFAQTPNFKDFEDTKTVEVGKELNFSSPRIVGKIGSAVFFMQREMEESGFVTSTLYKVEAGNLIQEIELSKSRKDSKFFVNARVFDEGILCYGYDYKNQNKEADLIFRIYSKNLEPVGTDHIIGSVTLDDEMLPLGVIKNQMTNLRALPVVRANFASEIYPTGDGNYEIWMTRLGVGPGIDKQQKTKTKAERREFEAIAEAVNFHQINFSSAGELISNTLIPINSFDNNVIKVIAKASAINNCEYIKTENGMVVCIESMLFPDNAGMNVFDDNRFPTVNIYSTAVLKFENGTLTQKYVPKKKYSELTRNIHKLDDGFLIIGFYTVVNGTSWRGVYKLKLDNDLQEIEAEFKLLEGNYTQEGLSGNASAMRGYKKDSEGIIRGSAINTLDDGSMILTGQLYTQFMVTQDRISKTIYLNADDFHGKRVTSTYQADEAKQVTHYYDKIVAFQILPDGSFSNKAFAIPLKQRKTHISPLYLGYSASSDGERVRILFNDTPEIFDKGYYSKNNAYTSDTGNSQVLQEYFVDTDFKINRNIYKDKSSLTLVPNGTVDYTDGSSLLYSDGKKLYVKDIE